MRQDKTEIETLRQNGWSYRRIQQETGVSRATLSAWFGKNDWSKRIKKEHMVHEIEAVKERMVRLNMLRKLKLQYQYALIEARAVKEYEQFKVEPLFWAGIMTYLGQGDTWSKGAIRISSSSFHSHRIFWLFSQKYLEVNPSSVAYTITMYDGQDSDQIQKQWANKLGLSQDSFRKVQVLQGGGGVKRLQNGIGMSILSHTALKKKLSQWLSLAQQETF